MEINTFWVELSWILVGRRSVSHSTMPCDLVSWQSIKDWPKLGLGSSLAFWVVETVDGAITSTWFVVLSQKSIDALNSYGQLLFDKDITPTIVLFNTILQNKQNASCFVTIDSWNSRWIDIVVKATKSFRVRGNQGSHGVRKSGKGMEFNFDSSRPGNGLEFHVVVGKCR